MPETKSDEERKMIIKKVNHLYETSDLTIKEACSEFGISDSTYYTWKKYRNLEPETEEEKTSKQDYENSSDSIDPETVKKVTELKEDKPFLGFKKISKQLAYSHGIKISTRQVKKILKENGLEETDYPEPKDHPARRFERNSSNEMWMMDIMHYTIEKEGCSRLYRVLQPRKSSYGHRLSHPRRSLLWCKKGR